MQLFNSLTFVMLAGNPLHCNCELRWFRLWLTNETETATKVLDSGDILCASPSTMTGLPSKYAYIAHRKHSCSARAKRTLFLAKSARTLAHFIM